MVVPVLIAFGAVKPFFAINSLLEIAHRKERKIKMNKMNIVDRIEVTLLSIVQYDDAISAMISFTNNFPFKLTDDSSRN